MGSLIKTTTCVNVSTGWDSASRHMAPFSFLALNNSSSDIIFFGEALPPAFFKAIEQDLPKCDLLIVMGTSLVVQPFASLCTRVPETTPRLYINMENTTGNDPLMAMLGMGSDFKFDQPDNYRDVFWRGTCDDGCYALADKLGWGKELRKLVSVEHARIMAENQADT